MRMHALGINSQFCLGNDFGKGGSLLAAKISPGDRFWQPILVWVVNHFWQLFAKINPEELVFGGTDFGVTVVNFSIRAVT